jgi:hypothetical protein
VVPGIGSGLLGAFFLLPRRDRPPTVPSRGERLLEELDRFPDLAQIAKSFETAPAFTRPLDGSTILFQESYGGFAQAARSDHGMALANAESTSTTEQSQRSQGLGRCWTSRDGVSPIT